MIKDNRKPKEYVACEYHVVETSYTRPDIPVRVILDENGEREAADTIDPITMSLVQANSLLGKIMGLNGEYSNEHEFWQLCEASIEHAKRTNIDREG